MTPFLLKPAIQHYLWGGTRLAEQFGIQTDRLPLAESWECSTHPSGVSTVTSGVFAGWPLSEVLRAHPSFLGEKFKGETELPLLVKLIDAEKDLSIQVHPTDAYAKEKENGQRGKTEMWYVLDAEENAKLICGFNKDCTADEVLQRAQDGTLQEILCTVPVKRGDAFFIAAGTVHAICAGCLVAEIQQSSNLTYRLYDYNRRDAEGNPRELHLKKAMDVAHLKAADIGSIRVFEDTGDGAETQTVVRCDNFNVFLWRVKTPHSLSKKMKIPLDNSFAALLCIDGAGEVITETGALPLRKGDCLFVPAENDSVTLSGTPELLCVQG